MIKIQSYTFGAFKKTMWRHDLWVTNLTFLTSNQWSSWISIHPEMPWFVGFPRLAPDQLKASTQKNMAVSQVGTCQPLSPKEIRIDSMLRVELPWITGNSRKPPEYFSAATTEHFTGPLHLVEPQLFQHIRESSGTLLLDSSRGGNFFRSGSCGSNFCREFREN